METALFRIRGNQQGMMGMFCECNPEGTNNLCCGEDLKTLIPDDSLRRALVQGPRRKPSGPRSEHVPSALKSRGRRGSTPSTSSPSLRALSPGRCREPSAPRGFLGFHRRSLTIRPV